MACRRRIGRRIKGDRPMTRKLTRASMLRDLLGPFAVATAIAASAGSATSAADAPDAGEPQMTAAPGTTMFESHRYGYSLALPPDWQVIALSQEPGSDEDLFEGP